MNKDFFFCCCKNENFQMKKLNTFQIFAKNIDYGYMLVRTAAKVRKMCTHVHPSFTKKWGVRGYILHGHVFVMFGT